MAVLLRWLAGYVGLLFTGAYCNFLAPWLRPLLELACLALGAFLVGVWFGGRGGACEHPVSRLGSSTRALVLLLPLGALIAVPHEHLGADSLKRTMVGTSALTAAEPAQPSESEFIGPAPPPAANAIAEPTGEPAAEASVVEADVFQLQQICRDPEQCQDRLFATEGMVYKGEEIPAGKYALLRFLMVCCVACAQPVGVLVDSPDADAVPEGEWVRVVGRLSMAELGGTTVPALSAREWERVPEPDCPYIVP